MKIIRRAYPKPAATEEHRRKSMPNRAYDGWNDDKQETGIKTKKQGGRNGIAKAHKRKQVGQAVALATGLWCDPSKWMLDGRGIMARHLKHVRAGLESLFPNGPDGASAMLIARIVYKSLKLGIYEGIDLAAILSPSPPASQPAPARGGSVHTPTEMPGGASSGHKSNIPNFEIRYVQMANSLREDIRLLTNLAKAQNQTPDDPDLREYLNALKKASKAQVITVERS